MAGDLGAAVDDTRVGLGTGKIESFATAESPSAAAVLDAIAEEAAAAAAFFSDP